MRSCWVWIWGVCLVWPMWGLAQIDRAGLFRVQISATPRQVPADGKSQARLRVEVRTFQGAAAPEGTAVIVHTDLGLLSMGTTGQQSTLTVTTSGGFAVLYVSSTQAGTATITVQVGGSRVQAYVEFLPPGEVPTAEVQVLHVTGGWAGYCPELNLIEARADGRMHFGKIEIQAGLLLQVDIERMIVKAQEVIVRRGDQELQGEDLYFELGAKRGVLRRFGEGRLERVFFDAVGMRPVTTEWELPSDAFQIERREAATWFVARSISYFPQQKIVLRRGSLWIGGEKMFNLPGYWVIGMPGYTGASNSQIIGVTSSGGLAIDFPYFYRVTDRATGAIRLQHGTTAGSVMTREGWTIALSEEYRTGRGVEGSFVVSGLPRSDWGFEWRDTRPLFGDGFGAFSFAMPEHRSVFADASLYRKLGPGRLNVQAYYMAPYEAGEAYGLINDWLLDPRPLGKGQTTYRLGTSLGLRRFMETSDLVFSNELYGEVNFGSSAWGKRLRVSPRLSNTYAWDTGGYHENSLRGQIRWDYTFGPSVAGGLLYTGEWRQGNEPTEGFRQQLSLDLRAHQAARWFSYLSATYDLTNADLYAMLNFDYALSKQWRAGLLATYYDFGNQPFDDLELSLGYVFSDREIRLAYSTATGRIFVSLGGFALK